MDKSKFQFEGIKWLFEMELLNHPQAINTIKLNILMVSKRIKEVELLIYRENRTMLVLLDLSWIGRKLFKKQIFTEVQEVLNDLLPSFRFRITDNPEIMKMAVKRVEHALTGGKNENSTNSKSSNDVPKHSGVESSVNNQSPGSSEDRPGSIESTETNKEEPSNTGQDLLEGSSENDRKKE